MMSRGVLEWVRSNPVLRGGEDGFLMGESDLPSDDVADDLFFWFLVGAMVYQLIFSFDVSMKRNL
jgi:hypothetical protein